jgi:hypothetical protein
MVLRIVTADQRAAEAIGVKCLVVGPSGVGKTSLLRSLDASKTLFLDVEAGDLSVSDVAVDAIRPQTWPELRDIACWLGGPNRAFPASSPYSEAHYEAVCAEMGPPESLEKYDTLFVDSLSVASRICLAWAQTQPDAFNKQGQPDPRGAYGLLGREFVAWATQLQHTKGKNVILLAILDQVKDDFGRLTWEIQIAGAASGRQLPGIFDQVVTMAPVDFGDGAPVRAFVTKFNNEYGFPAKDRSGRLDEIEEPDLGKLIAKAADQERRREAFGTSLPPRVDAPQQAAA